ncbi:hypothetical protein CsSME_00021427 [Camellia sinensis var. sinensis]
MFAPIVIIWLISIFAIGLYNTIYWNPKIVYAISPHYIIKFVSDIGKDGWILLVGILLSITGTEAMFADLGHFIALSIRMLYFGLSSLLSLKQLLLEVRLSSPQHSPLSSNAMSLGAFHE